MGTGEPTVNTAVLYVYKVPVIRIKGVSRVAKINTSWKNPALNIIVNNASVLVKHVLMVLHVLRVIRGSPVYNANMTALRVMVDCAIMYLVNAHINAPQTSISEMMEHTLDV